jgi:hypothetical protein
MEPTVLENLRVCLRAKKLQPAEVVGALSENYHGYAQVRARAQAGRMHPKPRALSADTDAYATVRAST